ncbi:MAG: hypothetical protein ABEJ08_00465 [Halobacteriaceae archaeon]
MVDADIVDAVRRSLDPETRSVFNRRVEAQADRLRDEISAGAFDNGQATLGLELEAYAVDETGRLARVPDSVFEQSACEPELGRHNVELNTPPDHFDAGGIADQAATVERRVAGVRDALDEVGLDLVLDGMWTIPPAEGTQSYLGDVEVVDGVTVAANMRQSPRYCAIDNDVLGTAGGEIDLDLPGVDLSVPTILVESLTASIQPHVQIPATDAFVEHYTLAIRTMGPVLALATNSPFLPADLYATGERESGAPRDLVDRTHHELRVPVFEQSIDADADQRKVRFPRDVSTPTAVIDALVDDRVLAPFLKEWVKDPDAVDGYADRIWELDHKRSTYWRWLRAVPGGEPTTGVDERSLRIEYRPLPTQPSTDEVVGFQSLVAGLIRGLALADHPLSRLDWSAARQCFYDVVADGLDADLAWVDADGQRTADPDVVFGEVFEYARRGLREQGLADATVDSILAPVERRWETRLTPSRWKKRQVRHHLDRGADLPAAVEAMQRTYVDNCRTDAPLVEW